MVKYWLAGSRQRKALLITDSGLVKAGLIQPIADTLSSSGFSVEIFDKVVADPPEHVVAECVTSAKAFGADIVIGLGGGSSLDIAKLVAVAPRLRSVACRDVRHRQRQGIARTFGADTDDCRTGSEVTNISIITTGETTKMGVVSPSFTRTSCSSTLS